jgi:hypothetical protein
MEGKEGAVEKIPKLVSRLPETLGFIIRSLLCDEAGVLRYRFSDRRVEATIQRVKVVSRQVVEIHGLDP